MQRLHFIQRCFRIACACSLLVLSGVESVTNADELGTSVNSALVTVAPSIVRVRTIGNAGAEELEVASQVTTGVVISDRGEILTSLFGFSGQPAAIFVDDLDGQRVAAKVVARDYLRKLVLLQCGDGRFHLLRCLVLAGRQSALIRLRQDECIPESCHRRRLGL